MSKVKSPLVAAILSFILPGSGLLYVGYWKAALINFALVNAALLFCVFGFGDPTLIEHIHYLFLGLAALSAGYAHGVAASKHKADGEWHTQAGAP